MRISDWSSDVCSSDLAVRPRGCRLGRRLFHQQLRQPRPRTGGRGRTPAASARCLGLGIEFHRARGRRIRAQFHDRPERLRRAAHARLSAPPGDRKSVVLGKSVSVRLDLGGRRIIKKKKQQEYLVYITDWHKNEISSTKET